jgi:hypothetical protein
VDPLRAVAQPEERIILTQPEAPPVFVAGQVYRWLMTDMVAIAQALALPALLTACATYAFNRIYAAAAIPALLDGAPPAYGGALLAGQTISTLVSILCPAVAAAAIYRRLLGLEPQPSWLGFQIGWPEAMMAASSIVFGIMAALAGLGGAVAFGLLSVAVAAYSPAIASALVLAGFIGGMAFVLARLAPLGPLIMLRGVLAIDVAWRMTSGRAAQLTVAGVLVFVPFTLLAGAVMAALFAPLFETMLAAGSSGVLSEREMMVLQGTVLVQLTERLLPFVLVTTALGYLLTAVGAGFCAVVFRTLSAPPPPRVSIEA